jgi:hypothetical protein
MGQRTVFFFSNFVERWLLQMCTLFVQHHSCHNETKATLEERNDTHTRTHTHNFSFILDFDITLQQLIDLTNRSTYNNLSGINCIGRESRGETW